MLKATVYSTIIFSIIALSSCSKCATCVSEVTDPAAENTGEPLQEEFCERGRVFNDQLETYEDQGWECEVD